jgi:hypothetical protein
MGMARTITLHFDIFFSSFSLPHPHWLAQEQIQAGRKVEALAHVLESRGRWRVQADTGSIGHGRRREEEQQREEADEKCELECNVVVGD